ncbi:MAG: hypothetical protein KKD18_04810 [Nanoarchaeota archaeon]|nr:hypothetical protein [Nanoarchaeota archaeon]MBU0977711.1 hypothetical protein [Nanoarchaeota archaeon]
MNLQKEILEIKQRNKRVEADKAWETSFTRKIILALITYILITLFFLVAELPKPFINPIVPTVGLLISTLILPVFKEIWLKNAYE